MAEILKKIVEHKKSELEHFKRQIRPEELRDKVRDLPKPRGFLTALKNPSQSFAVIAEVKKKSPSKGVLRDPFDPVGIARDYEEHGATCLSVLTDEHFFGGHLDHLRKIHAQVAIPLLRKDFIWEPYQIFAAREAGADAILLIAAMLELAQAEDLKGLAQEIGLDVLFEVHDAGECSLALQVKANLVGVNNRDLNTFKVDVATTERLLPRLSKRAFVVSESGLDSRKILERLKQAGVGAFLIGESLIKASSPGKALKELL